MPLGVPAPAVGCISVDVYLLIVGVPALPMGMVRDYLYLFIIPLFYYTYSYINKTHE